jgi:hypothetical protein
VMGRIGRLGNIALLTKVPRAEPCRDVKEREKTKSAR